MPRRRTAPPEKATIPISVDRVEVRDDGVHCAWCGYGPSNRSRGCAACVSARVRAETPASPSPPQAAPAREDRTSERERFLRAVSKKTAGDVRTLEAIEAFRQRQADGTAVPGWRWWSEFEVALARGQKVEVLLDPTWAPDVVRLELWGPFPPTGYRNRFVPLPHPDEPLPEFARRLAESFLTERKASRRGKGAGR